jgi:hypothetical protein
LQEFNSSSLASTSASAKDKRQNEFEAGNVNDEVLESERGVDLQLRATLLGQAPIEALTTKYIPSG